MKNIHQVLSVDDDPFIQMVLHTILKDHYQITTCRNGMEAMAWLEEGNKPDVIITDLEMPMFTGYELIRQVRASSLHSTIPIIVLSTHENSLTRIQCLEMGADDFVIKPFNPLEVRAKVEVILRRRNMSGLVS